MLNSIEQEESLEPNREIGNKWGMALSLSNLGGVAYIQCDDTAARFFFEENLAVCKEMIEKTLAAFTLPGLGLVDLTENNPEARENFLYSLRLYQETGEQLFQASSFSIFIDG